MIDDLKADPDFVMDEVEKPERISDKMDLPIGLSVRFGWSSYQTALFINALLSVCELGPKNEVSMISRSGVDKVKKRLLKKASEKRKEESKQVYNLQFDGKISEELSHNGHYVKNDHITVVDGLTGRYIDHFIPCGGTGRDLGIGLSNIITATESFDSLRAVNAGKHDFHRCRYLIINPPQ